MAITFPLTMPTIKDVNSFTLYMENVVAVSESKFTLQQQVQAHDGDRWVLEMSLPVMDREDSQAWTSFIAKLRGRRGTFLYQPVLFKDILGSGLGGPLVNGASQTGYELITDGWTPTSTDVLKAGDFFQLDNQLYMNLVDVSSDGGGNATLDIWPRARNHGNNIALVLTSPAGIFRLLDNAPRAVAFDGSHLFSTVLRAAEAK